MEYEEREEADIEYTKSLLQFLKENLRGYDCGWQAKKEGETPFIYAMKHGYTDRIHLGIYMFLISRSDRYGIAIGAKSSSKDSWIDREDPDNFKKVVSFIEDYYASDRAKRYLERK